MSSDARAIGPAWTLAACWTCGLIQKPDTRAWRRATATIYRDYDLYHQSGGSEQRVFSGGDSVPRSKQILAHLLAEGALPKGGRLLDVGCGTGAMLRAAGRLLPGWALDGHDLDDRHAATIRALPGVERFHGGVHVRRHYDLITLSHVLEHLSMPWAGLMRWSLLRRRGGRLLAQVPDGRTNPFDLMVADHACHFTPSTLADQARRAGLMARVADDWVSKELTLVAGPGPTGAAPPCDDGPALAPRHLGWLRDVAWDARDEAPDAVFGSSIAATWLAACLPAAPACFVDEDPDRVGRSHGATPIRAPGDLEDGCRVYVPAVPSLREPLLARLEARYPRVRWLGPPPYGEDGHDA